MDDIYDVKKNYNELVGWDGGKYFGQWETDKQIEGYFPNKTTGYCIEVGAANGVKGSNTLYFERLGWHALCIEPNKKYKESLEANRKHVVYRACSDESGYAILTVFDVGKNNIMSSISSINPDQRLIDSHYDIINSRHEILVKKDKLSNILIYKTKNTPFDGIVNIDFISIDTEGTELDVLRGFDFSMYDVKLFVVENNFNDPEIEIFMRSKGYIKDKRYKINDFYIKK